MINGHRGYRRNYNSALYLLVQGWAVRFVWRPDLAVSGGNMILSAIDWLKIL
jgi:hypothetical protein